MSVSRELEFGPETLTQCEVIHLIQDNVCEDTMTESFGVRLSSTGNGITAVQDRASIVIYDASECSELIQQEEQLCTNC